MSRRPPASRGRSEPPTIHRAMRYSIFAGGKRIRPTLVVAAGEGIGGDRTTLVHLGAAIEMIHTYSLIHDDLPALDNDDLRRGRPTCHKVFGDAMAILAGDALMTCSYQALACLPGESPIRCGLPSSVKSRLRDRHARRHDRRAGRRPRVGREDDRPGSPGLHSPLQDRRAPDRLHALRCYCRRGGSE